MDLLLTDHQCITAVGHSSLATTAAARAGIQRHEESDIIYDCRSEAAIVAPVREVGPPLDPYRAEECVRRLASIADAALKSMLSRCATARPQRAHLFLGVAPTRRPGPRYEAVSDALTARLGEVAGAVRRTLIDTGNSAALDATVAASEVLSRDPTAFCVVGALDSLIEYQIASWLEAAERLKSATFGRNHGMILGEAAGFFILESPEGVRQRRRRAQVSVVGLGCATEPAPFLSSRPTHSEGLTGACSRALRSTSPTRIDLIVSDMDGEFHRAREWACVDVRCLQPQDPSRRLWHPADALGTIGAASGAVQVCMAASAISRGWSHRALVLCSDDGGSTGAVVLERPDDGGEP